MGAACGLIRFLVIVFLFIKLSPGLPPRVLMHSMVPGCVSISSGCFSWRLPEISWEPASAEQEVLLGPENGASFSLYLSELGFIFSSNSMSLPQCSHGFFRRIRSTIHPTQRALEVLCFQFPSHLCGISVYRTLRSCSPRCSRCSRPVLRIIKGCLDSVSGPTPAVLVLKCSFD